MLCFRKPPLLLDSFADANYLTATDKGISDQTPGDYGVLPPVLRPDWFISGLCVGMSGL